MFGERVWEQEHMIRYALRCGRDHTFESWFASAEAYDRLRRGGLVSCPVCGSDAVEKAMMAPDVRPSKARAMTSVPPPASEDVSGEPDTSLAEPVSELEAKLEKLRRHVEENSDYVGHGFASEARRMHDGEIPHRSIYGEAGGDEARKLFEDGVPVAPLPFIPSRKAN